MAESFFTDIWENGGRELAHEIIKKSEKDTHNARETAKAIEKTAELESLIASLDASLMAKVLDEIRVSSREAAEVEEAPSVEEIMVEETVAEEAAEDAHRTWETAETEFKKPKFIAGEKKLQDILFARPNVEKRTGVKITSLNTENGELRSVGIEDRNGKAENVACDGLFVAIGLIPENDAFAHLADLNKWGYFDSDERCETKTPGIFAAGDCRSKTVRQLTTAACN